MPTETTTPNARRTGLPVVAALFWAVAALGAAAGGFVTFTGVAAANGAPQEAAAAAIGCSIAIVPYVLARAVHELTQ